MALSFVFFSIAVFYIAEKIREQLAGKIGEYVLEKIEEYVALPIGDYLDTPIGRQLGYLLSLAVLYVAQKSRETLEEKIGKYGRQLGYLLSYSRNIKNFRIQMENLISKRDEVQGLVDAAKKKDEVILPKVEKWLTSVAQIAEESGKVFDDELQSNLKLLYRRISYAKEKTEYVDELTREGNDFDRVYTSAVAFESRDKIFKDIMEALKDDKINMIGIYGMGGVGKTTLAKQVEQQSKDDNLFDAIVMVVVSQTPDWGKIKLKIAETLDSKVGNKGESQREGQGSTQKGESQREEQGSTKDKKRILIILDDIWKDVKLEETIEISFGMKHKGCKVMLTSRSEEVCDRMDTDKNFSVEVITEEEGWNLFRKTAGDSVDSPDLHPLAVEIAKKCAGLPIAIVTVATALKNKKSSFVWRNALNDLRNSTHKKEVFAAIELSYNHLEDEEAKSFFLLCCLFPDDTNIPIQFLKMYGIGLRWFKGVNTVDEASDKAHTLAQSLKSSCLLQHSDVKEVECVKMHDVIRDFAISIASNDEHQFLVSAGIDWKELPDADAFKRYTAMSLVSRDIHELPVDLDCPKLEILLLGSLGSSLQFSKSFSLRMESLKVLNICCIHSLSLPSSLQNLKNLRTLCLAGCSFIDISIVGELNNLEILSFFGSAMEELPKEIGMLTQLRLLDLIGCNKLTVILPDVVRGLSRLEGLYMMDSFDKWEIEREDKERSNASLEELNHLSRLINLEIQIPDANLWPKDLLFESLSRFKIRVGTSFEGSDQSSNSKILELELDVSTGLKDGIKGLLKKVEDLSLRKMKGLKSVVYDLDREGFQDLRHLVVKECGGLEYIFNASERVSLVAFPILEKLDLNDLENLKEICHGRLPSEFFSKLQELRLTDLPELKKLWKDTAQHVCLHNLTVVKVENCDGLKNLFSHTVAKGLSKLVKLKVRNCKMMEEIVEYEKEAASAAVDDIVFPYLRSLKLGNLPKLRNFCSKMKGDLFDKKVAFPTLETLQIDDISNLMEIQHSQLLAGSFSQLKVLNVKCCHRVSKVSKVVSFNLLRSLEELYVQECDSLEEVIEVEGLVVEERNLSKAPFQLRELKFWILPKLKHVMRWDMYPHGTLDFRNLSSIDIYKCDSLKCLFSPSMASSLLQLQKVKVDSCKMMESIIAVEREGEDCIEIVEFLQLRTLTLKNLPKLISFRQTFTSIFSIQQKRTFKLGNRPRLINFMKTFTSIFSIQQKHMITDEIVKAAPHEGNLCNPLQPLFDQKVAFPVLEILQIKNIGNLIEIGLSQLPVKSFSQLKVLRVEGCHKVSKIVPFNLLKWLLSLEELSIENCDSMEEIIGVEGLVVEEGHVSKTLSQWKNLKLRGLPKLKHIMQWDMYPHGTLGFQNLSPIHVYECNSLTSLLSPSMASNLVQLQELEIDSCKMMESIIAVEREGEDCIEIVEFPQLRTLRLKNLPKLISFRQTFTSNFSIRTTQEGNLDDPIQPLFDKKVSFPQLKVLNVEGCHKVSKVVPFNLLPSLEELNVQECDSLEEVVEVEVEGLVVEEGNVNETLSQLKNLKLWKLPKLKHIIRCDKYPHRILGFRNLSSIHIYKCNSLKSLFSPSMANCLAQLKKVEINSCEMMESIITEEREGEENWEKIIVFPQLCTLKLLYLPKLICFMKTFTSIISIQQKLLTDDKIVKEAPQEGNLCDPIQPYFNEKVAFPVLETLKIENIGNLIEIGLSQLPVKSFSQLKVDGLVVEEGHVSETPFQLRELKLRGLLKLKHIMRWDMYPHGTLGFQNLSSIHIFECNSLASLFSPSMASNLVQLQELEINSCEMMESIIAEERQGEDCIKIVEFPRLSTLQLKNLPKLINFMQTFTSNFSIQQKLMISDEVSKVATQEGNLGDPIKPLFDQKVRT